MATTLSDLIPGGESGGHGLTRDGVREAVERHCEFEGHRTTKSLLSVRDMYRVLIVRGEASVDDLLEYFRAYDNHAPEQGLYTEIAAEQWFDDVAAPNLARLPGVVLKDDTVRFEGVNPSDYKDEHTRPLEEIRSDSEVRAGLALDRLGVARGTSEREEILTLVSALADAGSATSDELDTVEHGLAIADHEQTLAKLPVVERTEEHPPDPEEIAIDTYADVLSAREAVEADTVVRWEFADRP